MASAEDSLHVSSLPLRRLDHLKKPYEQIIRRYDTR